MNAGSASLVFPGNVSPWRLTRRSSPHRASATCSSSDTSSRSGHTRRTATRRTHGRRSTLARTSARLATKKFPAARGSTDSICAREVFLSSPLSSIRVTGNRSGSSSQYALPRHAANTAMPANIPATRVSLARMRELQHLHTKILIGNADRPRRHRHERVVRHAGRGVHFQQDRLAALVEHQVDPAPAAAAEGLERLQAHGLDFLFLLRGQAAGDEVARVVRDVLRLVIVELARRLDADDG